MQTRLQMGQISKVNYYAVEHDNDTEMIDESDRTPTESQYGISEYSYYLNTQQQILNDADSSSCSESTQNDNTLDEMDCKCECKCTCQQSVYLDSDISRGDTTMIDCSDSYDEYDNNITSLNYLFPKLSISSLDSVDVC